MKIAVLNFSGNVGKSTIAKHLLLPRIEDAELISVETINSDESDGEAVKGSEFGALSEQLLLTESAVIDVGSSNVEQFVRLMDQYKGSHEDVDFFVIPVVKESKQMRDTINTINTLSKMGVDSARIRVVFNMIETDDAIDDAFYPLLEFHKASKSFTLRRKAAIQFSELYQRLRSLGIGISELLADQTDLKAKLRECQDVDEKQDIVTRISARRLATSADQNLNAVFATLTASK